MRGNITRRGAHSWRLKFDVGRDAATGKRKFGFHTIRGTKRQAQVKLAELITSLEKGAYVEPSKITVAEFVRGRVDQWEAAGNISARTAQRYRQLAEHQIVPHLGTMILQRLRPLDIETWHATLRNTGRVRGKGNLSPRTIAHAHKVLGKSLADAAKNEIVSRNVARLKLPPKVTDTSDEMVIVRDVPALLEKLQGCALHVPALLGLLCGIRLGEVLALRWSRIDTESKVIQVREAMEQTKAHGIRFKAAKTRAGRRDITMPDDVVEALRAYRRQQLELRMQLGAGRLPDDALLFTNLDGEPRSLSAVSRAWSDFAQRIGMPDVTFHGLRHTHASQLIDAGVDIVTISKRLGHAKPDITLRIYAHLFKKDDSKAAAAINAALKR
jgi:integrase